MSNWILYPSELVLYKPLPRGGKPPPRYDGITWRSEHTEEQLEKIVKMVGDEDELRLLFSGPIARAVSEQYPKLRDLGAMVARACLDEAERSFREQCR